MRENTGDVLKAGKKRLRWRRGRSTGRSAADGGLWKKFGEKWPGCELVLTPHGEVPAGVLNAQVGRAAQSSTSRATQADFQVRVKDGGYLPAAVIAVWAEKFMQDLGLRGGVGMYRAHHTYPRGRAGVELRRGSAATRGGVSGAGRQVLPLPQRAPWAQGVIWIQKTLGIRRTESSAQKPSARCGNFRKKTRGLRRTESSAGRPTARWGTIKGPAAVVTIDFGLMATVLGVLGTLGGLAAGNREDDPAAERGGSAADGERRGDAGAVQGSTPAWTG